MRDSGRSIMPYTSLSVTEFPHITIGVSLSAVEIKFDLRRLTRDRAKLGTLPTERCQKLRQSVNWHKAVEVRSTASQAISTPLPKASCHEGRAKERMEIAEGKASIISAGSVQPYELCGHQTKQCTTVRFASGRQAGEPKPLLGGSKLVKAWTAACTGNGWKRRAVSPASQPYGTSAGTLRED